MVQQLSACGSSDSGSVSIELGALSVSWSGPSRCPEKLLCRFGGLSVTEQLLLLDLPRDLGWYVILPGRVPGLDLGQHLAREDRQALLVVFDDRLDEVIVQQIGVQMPQVGGDIQIVRPGDGTVRVQEWIHVES